MTQEEITRQFDAVEGPLYQLCYLLSGNRVLTASYIRRLFELWMASGRTFSQEDRGLLWFAEKLHSLGWEERKGRLEPSQDILPGKLRSLSRRQKLLLFLNDSAELPVAEISRWLKIPSPDIRREVHQARREAELKRGQLRQLLSQVTPSPDERKQIFYSILERWPQAERRLHARRQKEKRIGLGIAIGVIALCSVLLLQRPAKIQPGIYDDLLIPEYRQVVEIYRLAASQRWKANAYQEKGLSPLVNLSPNSESYGYFLRDLDQDGSQELLFAVDKNLGAIYTMVKGIPTLCLAASGAGEYRLCENGAIQHTMQSGQVISYTFHRLSAGELLEENRLIYDPEGVPSPWILGFDRNYASADQARFLLEQYSPNIPAIQPLME